MADRSDVIVLFGGESGERRVSVASAQHVLDVLGTTRAVPWFVTESGAVHEVSHASVVAHPQPFELDFPAVDRARSWASLDAALDDRDAIGDRVFFLALHGGSGEDGTVQKQLADRARMFTASDAASSARAFHKGIAKRIVSEQGVLTAPAEVVPVGDVQAAIDVLAQLVDTFGHTVAKPLADGSSVGLHHVRSHADCAVVAAAIATSGREYIAEAFVTGRELTVGVISGKRAARALPASEVQLEPGRVFDFDGKYLGKGTIEITPADVDASTMKAAQDVALQAHRALGCFGYSRTDVILGPRGPVFLETNTLPGLTRASFLPQQLAAERITMAAFLDGQIALARNRY